MSDELTAADVMNQPVRSVEPEATILEAARILREHRVGSLVVEDETLDGIVTESDVVAAVSEEVEDDEPIRTVMSSPVVTARPTDTIDEVATRMGNNRVKKLPITERGETVGIITTTDLADLLPGRTVKMSEQPEGDLSKGEYE